MTTMNYISDKIITHKTSELKKHVNTKNSSVFIHNCIDPECPIHLNFDSPTNKCDCSWCLEHRSF